MSYETPVAPTLFDLIARSWVLPGPVSSVAFNHDQSSVAFAGGGTVGIASLTDPERPEARIRVAADTGRATIQPRQQPIRPLALADKLAGPLAAFGDKSFVTGGARDRLIQVTPRGQTVPIRNDLPGPVSAVARDPSSSLVAAASGTRVCLIPEGADPFGLDTPSPVTALAFAPRDGSLAIGLSEGIAFWHGKDEAAHAELDEAPTTLVWSPDGSHLACGFNSHGFALVRREDGHVDVNHDYPTPVHSFAWDPEASVFATSGAFRTVAWEFSPAGRGEPVGIGRAGLVVVDRIAASPTRPLIAVGYSNGLLCLAKVNHRDEMALRHDGSPFTALTWSADGNHLALGCEDGTAALISFPPHMFK